MTNLPSKLYKYRSIDGASKELIKKIIQNETLYFAKASTFNDPFELNFPVKKLSTKEKADYLKKVSDREAKGGRKARRSARSTMSKYYKNNSLEQKATSKYKEIYRDIPILCMSSNPENILMWSYYADSHKGVCLRYNISNEFKKYFMHIKRVVYSQNRFQIDLSKSDDVDQMIEILTTKSTKWQHEEEYRIFKNDIRASSGVEKMPLNSLDGIIFGANCTENDIQEIISLCSGKKHIEFYISTLDEKEFKLNISKM